MKKFITITIALLFILPLTWAAVSYKGPKRFYSQNTTLPQALLVIENAKSLIGTLYDPLMGQYDNIGGKLGFIVCSDVPNIAYGLSGYSLENQLRTDFKLHRSFYNTGNVNTPGNSYFHRRARNLFAYFEANKRLYNPLSKPKVGDLAFYKKSSSQIISHVALVSEVEGSTYKIIESAPKTLVTTENESRSPISRGWILMGFGRIYSGS